MVGFEEMRDELLERIEDLLKRKQYTALRDLLADLEPADIASLFEDLDEDSIPLLFRLGGVRRARSRRAGDADPRLFEHRAQRGP